MHPQLLEIVTGLEAARQRLHALAARLSPGDWQARPAPESWSAAECVAHLNLTSAAFIPPLDAALDRIRSGGKPAPRRYRRDLVGWLLWFTQGEPARVKVRTTAAFVPQAGRPAAELVAEFDRLQDAQIALVERADGLPLDERIPSPFDPRARYSVYSALTLLPRHQHRHLGQAEQAQASLPR